MSRARILFVSFFVAQYSRLIILKFSARHITGTPFVVRALSWIVDLEFRDLTARLDNLIGNISHESGKNSFCQLFCRIRRLFVRI